MPNKIQKGEELFENYLASQGITEFERERNVDERSKQGKQTPDYIVKHRKQELVFEVLEINDFEYEDFGSVLRKFRGKNSALRKEINDRKKKFEDYKDKPCALVILSPLRHATWFVEPTYIFEDMYGDLEGISSYDKKSGHHIPELDRWVYGKNRKMHEGSKTYISAIITLLKIDETKSRIIIFENYFAKNPLPVSFGRGAYDIRYKSNGLETVQTFAGKEIIKNKFTKFPVQFR